MSGYLYLSIPRDAIEGQRCLIKIGKTIRNPNERLAEYRKGSQILSTGYVKDLNEAETYLIREFNINGSKQPKEGNEYFEFPSIHLAKITFFSFLISWDTFHPLEMKDIKALSDDFFHEGNKSNEGNEEETNHEGNEEETNHEGNEEETNHEGNEEETNRNEGNEEETNRNEGNEEDKVYKRIPRNRNRKTYPTEARALIDIVDQINLMHDYDNIHITCKRLTKMNIEFLNIRTKKELPDVLEQIKEKFNSTIFTKSKSKANNLSDFGINGKNEIFSIEITNRKVHNFKTNPYIVFTIHKN
jgi:hypothetical protein